MRGRRFKAFGAAVAVISVPAILSGCDTTEVDPDDQSPPVLTVSLLPYQGAEYSDGSPVVGAIDTTREFRVDPFRPTGLTLLFGANDKEGGIRSIDGEVTVTMMCHTTDLLGLPISRMATKELREDFEEPAAPGEETRVGSAVAITITPIDLWKGTCDEGWWQRPGETVTQGRISGIEGEYVGNATNNSQRGANERGRFSAADVVVEYDPDEEQ